MDRRVVIQRQGAAVDNGYTTKPGDWATLGERWAQLIRSRGREVFENLGIEADVPLTILMRFDALTRTITEKDRLVVEGRAFNLKSVVEIGRRDGIECVGVAGD